jgi:hypothetical protein
VTNAVDALSPYEMAFLIIFAAAVVAIGVAFSWFKSRADEQRREMRLAAIKREADHFFDGLTATGTVPDVAVNIVFTAAVGLGFAAFTWAAEPRSLTSDFGRSTRVPSS